MLKRAEYFLGGLASKVYDWAGYKRYRETFVSRIFSDGVFTLDSNDIPVIQVESGEFREYEIAWLKHFSGKLPKRWLNWTNAEKDIESTKIPKIQLDEELIDMLATHPEHSVVGALVKHQKLSRRQLAIVFARIDNDVPNWRLTQIIKSQQQMGSTNEYLHEMYKLGKGALGNTHSEKVFGLLEK